MGLPTPRPVGRKPYFKFWPSVAWTTLALTLHADGSSEHELVGASPFPRHWIYDDSGTLVEKSGVIDFKRWFDESFGEQTPWGSYDSPALVTAVESALEHQLSQAIMRGGGKPAIRTMQPDEVLVTQGEQGTEIFLVLDGVLAVEIDGEVVAEIGPGAIVGERAFLEGGTRTATLRATTRARVATARGEDLTPDDLAAIASGHRREEG
jgi:hypothetical protein